MKRFILAAISATTLGITLASGANAFKPVEFSTLTNQVETVNVAQAISTPQPFVTVEQEKETTGTASVVTENGQTYIVFDDAFDTARGPDVQVVLHTGATVPVSIDEADYVTLATLQSFEGGQRYLVPANIDVNDYQTVAIWCREFNVTFGYAPL